MAIERLVTMAIDVGNRDAVWLGAVVSRDIGGAREFRYEPYYGRRGGVLQTLRTPRAWGPRHHAELELSRTALQKESEGYQHIDWTLTRFGIRSTVRALAAIGTIIPATARTGRIDPATLAAPVGEAVSPHLYVASTLRGTGGYVCGAAGCHQERVAAIHYSHLSRHSFLRSANNWCVDCRQGQSHPLHQQPTLRERSNAFLDEQYRIWINAGSRPHPFSAHPEFVSVSNRPFCTECGSVESMSYHNLSEIQAAWASVRRETWRHTGRIRHEFTPNPFGYRGDGGELLCDACALTARATNAHDTTDPAQVQRWWTARRAAWLDAGQEQHDYIPSDYHGPSGVQLCIICGFAEGADSAHTGRVDSAASDRFAYADLWTWADARFLEWTSGTGGRRVHEFKSARYANPLTMRGTTLCEWCGLQEVNREKNHGSDKPAVITPHQYEPVVRRRRPEPGF